MSDLYTFNRAVIEHQISLIVSLLNDFVIEVIWSGNLFSAAPTLQSEEHEEGFSNVLLLFFDYTLLLVTLIMKVTLLYTVYGLYYSVKLSFHTI